MKQIESFEEVLNYLTNNEIVTLIDGNYFVKRNNKIVSYNKGNRIVMSIEDFKKLYYKNIFYEFEIDDSFVDPLKDQEYYGFKHK